MGHLFLRTIIENIVRRLCILNVLWTTRSAKLATAPSCYGPPQSESENRQNFVP